MNPLDPEIPFFERHQYMAQFVHDGSMSTPVQVAVEFSKVQPGEILGTVLGGHDAQRVVSEATRATKGMQSVVSHVPVGQLPPGASWEIRSDEVTFQQIIALDTRTEGLVRRTADFRAFSLEIDSTAPGGSPELSRAIVFYLYGPSSVWDPQPVVSLHLKSTPEFKNSDLGLKDGLLRAEVGIERQRAKSPDDSDVILERSVIGLAVLTDASINKLPDDQFRNQAIALANDILLLTSLAAKTWVDWFRWTLYSDRQTIEHVRSTFRTPQTGFRHYNQMLVEPPNLREFLQTALPVFRGSGKDLRLPILTHLSAESNHVSSSNLLTRFTALEALRARFAKLSDLEYTLSPSEFKRVRRTARKAVESLGLEEAVLEVIKAKLPELNRPTFEHVLSLLLDSLNLQLVDLYPPGIEPTLISTRNMLVHRNKEIEDSAKLYAEYVRLTAIVDRILLRLLGWGDISNAPAEIDLAYVTKEPKAALDPTQSPETPARTSGGLSTESHEK